MEAEKGRWRGRATQQQRQKEESQRPLLPRRPHRQYPWNVGFWGEGAPQGASASTFCGACAVCAQASAQLCLLFTLSAQGFANEGPKAHARGWGRGKDCAGDQLMGAALRLGPRSLLLPQRSATQAPVSPPCSAAPHSRGPAGQC